MNFLRGYYLRSRLKRNPAKFRRKQRLLQLQVRFPSHDIAHRDIQFDPKSTIAEAQKRIEGLLNLPSSEYFGILRLKPEHWLNPSKTLEFYSLSDGESVSLKKTHQTVKIRLADDTCLTVLVDTRQSVSEITNSIASKLGLTHPEEFSLAVSTKSKHYPHSNRCGIISTAEIEILTTTLDAEIDDSLCHFTVSQTFHNTTDSPIEALYTFPIVEGFPSIYGFQLVFDDGKTLEGTVMPKEEAEQKYDDAIASGHNATMLSKKSANSFELELGNIGAKQKLTVKIQCVSRLLYNKDGSLVFKFPATLVPMYDVAMETIVNGRVNMSLEIKNINNVQKPLQVEKLNSNSYRIYGNIVLLADLELGISTLPQEPPNIALLEYDKENNTCAAMFSFVLNKQKPPVEPVKQKKEIIFVVDRSGSMAGNPIKLVQESLQLFLRSLPLDCHFNIYGFGSKFDQIFDQSQQYNDNSLSIATSKCQSYKADLGGTDLIPVLKAIQNTTKKGLREIFVLTDGQVEREGVVLSMVKSMTDTRFFTLGLGNSVSTSFLETMAKCGAGTAEFYKETSSDSLQTKIIRQLSIALENSFRQLSVEWQDNDKFLITKQTENYIENEVVSVFAFIKPENIESFTLIRYFTDFNCKHEIPVKIVTGNDIHRIAITHLADAGLDMQSLAVRYHLITAFTNCIVVDKRREAIEKAAKLVRIETRTASSWLNSSQTLSENIGSLNNVPTLDFKKKFFCSDNSVSSNDPVAMEITFNDLKQKVLNGTMTCTRDEAIQLAALLKTIDPSSNLNLPSMYAKEVANVEKEARKLTGINEQNAKFRFVQMAKSLRSYGSTSFQSINKGQQFNIGSNGISIVDSKKGVQKDIQLSQIRRWAVQGNKVVIDTGDKDFVYLDTNDANQVSELIASYIDLTLKKRKDSSNVEEEAVSKTMSFISSSTVVSSPLVNNKYQNLIVLCKANGCWELNKEFAKVIGVELDKIKALIPEELKKAIVEENVLFKYWATCIALVVLEMEFNNRHNEWFMLAAKANEFLVAHEPNRSLFKEFAKNVK